MGVICGAALGFAIGYFVVLAFSGHIAISFRIKDVHAAALWGGGAVGLLGSIVAPMFAAEVFDD